MHSAKETVRIQLKKTYARTDLSVYTTDAIAHITSLPAFTSAMTVLAYTPRADEIQFVTTLMDEYQDKAWFLPDTQSAIPQFVHASTNSPWVQSVATTTICIVPARALTKEGERLGRGGGWYDRFLMAHPTLACVSVVPAFAFLHSIPIEEHDAKITHVFACTPKSPHAR